MVSLVNVLAKFLLDRLKEGVQGLLEFLPIRAGSCQTRNDVPSPSFQSKDRLPPGLSPTTPPPYVDSVPLKSVSHQHVDLDLISADHVAIWKAHFNSINNPTS